MVNDEVTKMIIAEIINADKNVISEF